MRDLVSKKQGREELRKALVNPEIVRTKNKIKTEIKKKTAPPFGAKFEASFI